ncbi:TonB-dependent siderophore receptor [Pseudorhodoferax sp. Leaf274]|uniref:TonB-dependent siderophore receptor n=1 Tax=Pseudorhodoferax sp. Leaf274 TaxID=1736318 RepID=UPI0009EABBE3|nr:TonB-dependent siderophore receptor [Pseudorhodoferax sp. Leaf274]
MRGTTATPVLLAAALAGPAAWAQASATLPEVKVTAEGETASGPARGFVAKRSATGTKTDTALVETPQSITVVTREQVEAQAADSLDQAFGYSAGITPLSGGSQRRISTSFTVRGFNVTGSAPLYVNGSKFPINSLSGAMELYAFERIELLKGPASILYGQAAPGGIINLVSKRPTATPLREVELQVGSWDRRQAAVDLAGPLSEDGRVSYRITALARSADAMVSQIADDRRLLNAALAWKLTPDTDLLLLAGYNKGKSNYDYGKPYDGTLLPNPNGRIARELFVGEPGFDKFDTEGRTAGWLLEHRLNADWTLKQNLLVFDYTSDNAYASIDSRADARTGLRTVIRTPYARYDTDDGWSLDHQVQGRFATGSFQHLLVAGLDFSDRDFTRAQRTGTAAALDLYNPFYGSGVNLDAAGSQSSTSARQLGLYLQDQIKLGAGWVALLGARYDKARNDGRSVSATGASSSTDARSHAFTPRAGLLYHFDNGLAPYYSYTRSFQPSSGTDFFGTPFKPTEGTQHELGLKYEPSGTNLLVTAAVYELTQTNVSTRDPDHAGFSVQTGEIRSRGFELEARASLDRQWDVTAALGAIDARVTKSNTANLGTRPTSVPRNTASVWVDHRFAAVPGLSAGLGVRRVGAQATAVAGLNVPSFTLVDAALRYETGPWRFALNVKNLADRNYVADCTYACFYGDERNATLTARYSW